MTGTGSTLFSVRTRFDVVGQAGILAKAFGSVWIIQIVITHVCSCTHDMAGVKGFGYCFRYFRMDSGISDWRRNLIPLNLGTSF